MSPNNKNNLNQIRKKLDKLDNKLINLIKIRKNLVDEVMKSSIGKNCISFSKMSIEETIPIIGACKYYIGNDTGWGHIASGLGLKSIFLFMDSPPLAYGVYSKNISVIIPDGETIESCSHNTRGHNRIPFETVLNKTIELLN